MPWRSYQNTYWIDGVSITPDRHPECLETEQFDCYACDYFDLTVCRLKRDPDLRQELKTLLDIAAENENRQKQRQTELIIAVSNQLKSHGRPLHYTVLAKIVQERNPELDVTEKGILVFMGHHPDLFASLGDGVFKLRQ